MTTDNSVYVEFKKKKKLVGYLEIQTKHWGYEWERQS